MATLQQSERTCPTIETYTERQFKVLGTLADLLLIRDSTAVKLRDQMSADMFWLRAVLKERVDELISEQAVYCERENLQREFALLVAGWPRLQQARADWTAKLLIESTAAALDGIAGGRSR